MKNILKITLFSIICFGSSAFAANIGNGILSKSNVVHFTTSIDSVKNPATGPERTDPKKRTILNNKNETDIFIDEENDSYIVKQLINVASDNIGVSYRGGGTTKDGFDCSGLIYSTFKKFDITLPRSSHEMAATGTEVDLSHARKGDLIFFINRGQRRINHVGMVVEVTNDEVKFIHSSTQSGVIISSTKEPYYNRTFVQLSRIIE